MNHIPLNFSINPDGRLSLWDSQRAAMNGKEDGEMVFVMTLTEEQLAVVEDMQSRSRKSKREFMNIQGENEYIVISADGVEYGTLDGNTIKVR